MENWLIRKLLDRRIVSLEDANLRFTGGNYDYNNNNNNIHDDIQTNLSAITPSNFKNENNSYVTFSL